MSGFSLDTTCVQPTVSGAVRDIQQEGEELSYDRIMDVVEQEGEPDLTLENTQFVFGRTDFKMNGDVTRIFCPEGRYSYDDVYHILSQVWNRSLESLPFRFNGVGPDDPYLIDLGNDGVVELSLPILGGKRPLVIIPAKPKPRGKRVNNTTTLRVVQAAPSTKPKKTRMIMQGAGAGETQFKNALKAPFSPSAFGCKVPDTFSMPTITGHVHYEVQLGTNASSIAAMTLFPSPMVAFRLNSGTATSGLSTFTTDASLFYFSSRTSMDTTFDQYRVVAMGVKVSNLMAPLSATGRFIFTPLVLGGTFPGFDLLNSGAGASSGYYLPATTGVTVAQSVSSAMLQKPSSVEITVQDLLQRSYAFTMIPTSPIFYKFKNCGAQQYNGGANLTVLENGEGIITTTTGVTSYNANGEFTDNMDMTGGIALNILGEGLPLNTSVLQVEVVLHLEGTPSVNTATNAVTLSGAQPMLGSTASVEQALGEASSSGVFSALKTGIENIKAAASNPYVRNAAQMAMGYMRRRNGNPRIRY